ncbi:hypothetical protein MNBD_ALPHA07-1188 [hydrothermal vent metagenome]|uniref:Uncharacterized protein n=1 Tax=hydrothermal vent metagenome TaxID=652676 RepID=A0A3B0SKX3_9ZZZZ
MKPFRIKTAALAVALSLLAGSAMAEPVNIEAVMTPTDQIRMDFKDGSKRFVLMVRRTGNATGSGLLAGTSVVEQGWHDINPPFDADPQGYLEMTAENGDVAYLKWTVRAVFTKGEEKPQLHDYGVWELVSGTGQFADKRGIGTLVIKPVTKTDRKYILSGEIGDKP